MKRKDASTDVAEYEEEPYEKAAEIPERNLLNHEEDHADASFNVEHKLQKLRESITMSGKDWDTNFMSVASESWDFGENLIDDAPTPLSKCHERVDPDIGEDNIVNHMVSRATTPPQCPLFFSGPSPDDVE